MSIKPITSGVGRSVLPHVVGVVLATALTACQGTAPSATNPVAGALPGDPADPGDEAPPPTPRPTNAPPVARLSITPARPFTCDPVVFDASGSTDPEGGVLTFRFVLGWIVVPAPTPADTGTTPRITQTLCRDPGLYKGGVFVTDPKGATSAAEATWEVLNRPPTAQLSASPARAAPDQLIDLRVDAADFNGRVTSIQWDFGPHVYYTQINGSYRHEAVYAWLVKFRALPATVSVLVRDNDGGTTRASLVIEAAP